MEEGSRSKSESEPEQIRVSIKGSDGEEIYFLIRPTTKLKTLTAAYCSNRGVDARYVRFLHDGIPLRPDGTPESMGILDGDVIDAFVQQTGG